MDGHRFDDLARILGAGTSRRQLLKALVGAGGGGALALLGLTGIEAAARCSAAKPCGTCRKCVNGHCIPAGVDARCAGCGRCQGGHCRPEDAACRPSASAAAGT
jgi:hypothetical protein